MATYKLEVIRRGTIIVDDVRDLEQAEEYIENCNPVDDVEWSSFLETTACGRELEEIYIPDDITIKKLAEKLGTKPAKIVSQLFVEGHVVTLDSTIPFETVKKIESKYDVLFKWIEKVTYYEDCRLKVVEQDGNYTVYDKKNRYKVIHKNKTKTWVDDYLQRKAEKREKYK